MVKKKNQNHFCISQLNRNWSTKENHKKKIEIKLKEQWKKEEEFGISHYLLSFK